MTSIQPELRADRGAEAVTFCQAAFGATVLHRAGDARTPPPSWPSARPRSGSPRQAGGSASTPRQSAARPAAPSLVEDPEAVFHHAVTAGATPTAPRQTNTAGGLPGSQTHSAINGKSGAPSVPGRHPHHSNHHRQLAYWQRKQPFPARADHLVQRPPQMAARSAPSSPSRSADPARQARKACNRT